MSRALIKALRDLVERANAVAWVERPAGFENALDHAKGVLADHVPAEGGACGGCGGPHPFDTAVPSVLWNRVIRPLAVSDYLCTICIVREFAKAGVSFTATLWGDGLDGLPISVEINGVASTATRELETQNTTLRAALNSIHDHVREALNEVTRATPPPTVAADPLDVTADRLAMLHADEWLRDVEAWLSAQAPGSVLGLSSACWGVGEARAILQRATPPPGGEERHG